MQWMKNGSTLQQGNEFRGEYFRWIFWIWISQLEMDDLWILKSVLNKWVKIFWKHQLMKAKTQNAIVKLKNFLILLRVLHFLTFLPFFGNFSILNSFLQRTTDSKKCIFGPLFKISISHSFLHPFIKQKMHSGLTRVCYF